MAFYQPYGPYLTTASARPTTQCPIRIPDFDGLQNKRWPHPDHSPAHRQPGIDAIPGGTDGCGTEITTDQRRVKRPQGSGCDIGAFEEKVRR